MGTELDDMAGLRIGLSGGGKMGYATGGIAATGLEQLSLSR